MFWLTEKILKLFINISYAGNTTGNGGSGTTITITNPLGAGATIETLLDRIIDFFAYRIGPIIAVGFIVYSAFQMITSAGDEKKFASAKATLYYTLIGYGILLLADGLVFVIKDVLLGSPSGG